MRAVHLLRKLNPSEWGGTETAIQRLCEGLREHGTDPVVYCPKLDGQGNQCFQSAMDVQRFKAFIPVVGLTEERRRQLVSVGGNLMSFDLLNRLWREKMDVMHTHALGRIGGIGLTVARKKRVPFVVSIHGGVLDLPSSLKKQFHDTRENGWDWGRFFGLLFQSHRLFVDSDAIITCNEKEAALLRKQHPQKRVLVHPHGVPFSLYEKDHRAAARKAFPQIEGKQLLVSVGRVDPVKNQLWLVEQAPTFLSRYPNALLVLAGPCTDEPYGVLVARTVKEAGLESRVLLTGGFPQDAPALIGLMQLASVVLLSSISETFGLVILEAWAAGAPVIATATSGATALIRQGTNGWLCKLEDPATLHRALDAVLANSEHARQSAIAGRELVRREYSVSALAGRMKNLYSELVEERQCVM